MPSLETSFFDRLNQRVRQNTLVSIIGRRCYHRLYDHAFRRIFSQINFFQQHCRNKK